MISTLLAFFILPAHSYSDSGCWDIRESNIQISCKTLPRLGGYNAGHSLSIDLKTVAFASDDPTSPIGETLDMQSFEGQLQLNNYTYGPAPRNTVWKITNDWRWDLTFYQTTDYRVLRVKAQVPAELGYSVELNLHGDPTQNIDSLQMALFNGTLDVGKLRNESGYAGINHSSTEIVRCEVTREKSEEMDCI